MKNTFRDTHKQHSHTHTNIHSRTHERRRKARGRERRICWMMKVSSCLHLFISPATKTCLSGTKSCHRTALSAHRFQT